MGRRRRLGATLRLDLQAEPFVALVIPWP